MIEALAGAVHRANERLSELVEEDPEREGMGSTVTALMFDGQQLGLAHLGDSRAYRMRDGLLYQLSHDHTSCSRWSTRAGSPRRRPSPTRTAI